MDFNKEYLKMDQPINETMIDEHLTLTYTFGKNGQGITDEILKVGERINQLSAQYNLYLTNSQLDPLDDVYTLQFALYPKEDNQNEEYSND